MPVNINSFQHLGIPVTDIETSERFYKRLGFDNVMKSTFKSKGENGLVSMMKRGEMVIELYQLPANEIESIRIRKDGHIDHIAFDVDDIDAVFQELKQEGFEIFEESPVFLAFWEKGCKYFNVKGPDGERLEFNQIL